MADDGPGSLRQAVNEPVPVKRITFAPALSGQTIQLTSGQLTLLNTVTLDASELPYGVTVSANYSSRVFDVLSGSTVVINSLSIHGGFVEESGGGVRSSGTLTLNRCTVYGNIAGLAGGGIYSPGGVLTLNQCTLSDNAVAPSGDGGGALAFGAAGGSLAVNQSTVSKNLAPLGGGILQQGGSLALFNSIVAGNNQDSGGNIHGNGVFTGVNLINCPPLLAPLGYYGGPTPTMPPQPGSPAIDAGAATGFFTDQRGYPRWRGIAPEVGATEGVLDPMFSVENLDLLADGSVRLGFMNLSGPIYSVLASTNVAAPLNLWLNIGPAFEVLPGIFQFIDLQAPNYPYRFYRVTTP